MSDKKTNPNFHTDSVNGFQANKPSVITESFNAFNAAKPVMTSASPPPQSNTPKKK
jgi:hypothetical protein